MLRSPWHNFNRGLEYAKQKMCSAELFHNHLDDSSYNSQSRFPTWSLSHNNNQFKRASILPLWKQKRAVTSRQTQPTSEYNSAEVLQQLINIVSVSLITMF